jgi:hypothetical protein
MALISTPADYSSATAALWSVLNTLKNTIYNEFNGNIDDANIKSGAIYDEFNGNIDDANIKSGAAITPSKVADTAVVISNTVAPGTQTITRPTTVSAGPFYEAAQGGFTADLSTAGNIQANALVGAAQTIAIASGKGVYTFTAGAAASLATITGGGEGDVIYLVTADTDVTLTHNAAATVDTLWFRGGASMVGVAGGLILRMRYSAVPSGTGKWYEV